MADENNAPVTLRRITFRNPDGTRILSVATPNQSAVESQPTSGEHIVDCDADPFCPDGLYNAGKDTEHRKGGKLILTPGKIQLFLAEGQKNRRYMVGRLLRQVLASKQVLNANVLDYLLKHQELIPDEWKGKAVFFWGTIYRKSSSLCVRYLRWNGDCWVSDDSWLGLDFSDDRPAAVLAP